MASDSLRSVAANIAADITNPKYTIPPHYYDLQPNRPYTFSTKGGTIPKRSIQYPFPPVIVRSDINADIQRKTKQLRNEFPAIVREIKEAAASWWDLHNYFDPIDLCKEGPLFLFYVINHISNENAELDKNLDASKLAEIHDWARLWVAANVGRALSIPITQDPLSIFEPSEQECVYGLEKSQLEQLKDALIRYRREQEVRLEEQRMQAIDTAMQQTQQMPPQMYHPDPSFHPNHQHTYQHQMQNSMPIMAPGMPLVSQGPNADRRGYPITMDESHRSSVMMSQSMPHMQHVAPQNHPHTSYDTFMGSRGQVSTNSPLPGQGDLRQESQIHWQQQQQRPRGWSNGRGRVRGPNNHLRSTYRSDDRRIVAEHNASRASPLRRVSETLAHQDPVYIHDSRRQPLPYDKDATPRASVRNMMPNNYRMVSDPLSGRTAFPNDARLWQEPQSDRSPGRQRANSKAQEAAHSPALPPPFEGNPSAHIVSDCATPSCTFWYEGYQCKVGYREQSRRTVFVKGFRRLDFETHALKEVFERFGQIESINFLYREKSTMAFIAFVEGSESSVQHAINGLDGYVMRTGEKLGVDLPRSSTQFNTQFRSRSDSQTSEIHTHMARHRSNSTLPRDISYRDSSQHGYARGHSGSLRTPFSSGEYRQAPPNASENTSPTQTPLTEGFQLQLQPTQPFPMQQVVDRLSSSMAEITQHQAAFNRFSGQNQISGGIIETSAHARNLSSSEAAQPRMVLSQGSYTHKDKSPVRNVSGKSTKSTSPKKKSSHNQGDDNLQKPSTSKYRNHGKNNKWSKDQSRAQSPVNNNFQDMMFAALALDEKRSTNTSSVELDSKVAEITAPKISTADTDSLLDASNFSIPEFHTPQADTSESTTLKNGHLDVKAIKEAGSNVFTPKPSSEEGITASTNITELNQANDGGTMNYGNFKGVDQAKSFEGTCLRSPDPKFDTSSSHVDGLKAKPQGLASNELAMENKPQVSIVPNLKPGSDVLHSAISSQNQELGVSKTTKSQESQDKSTFEHSSPAHVSQNLHDLSQVESKSKPKKKSKRKAPKKRSPSKADADLSLSTASLNSAASLNSKASSETLKSSCMTENSDQFVTAHSSPNPSLTSAPPDVCQCPPETPKIKPEVEATISNPLGKKHQNAMKSCKHSKTDSNVSADSTPKSSGHAGENSLQNHSKTNSIASNISTSSVRKADKKLKKPKQSEKSNENTKPAEKIMQGLQKATTPHISAMKLNDSTQWPLLDPVQPPAIDGKISIVPALQPLSERKKNPNAVIIPALPLNMQQRRRPES